MDATVSKFGEFLVVGHDDKRLAELVAKVKEKLMQFCLILAVKTARRLVGKDDIGLVHKGTCYSNTLLFATGKLVGLMIGAVRESHKVKEFLRAATIVALLFPCYHTGYHHVFQSGKFGEKLMELKYKTEMLITEM